MNQDTAYDATCADSGIARVTAPILILVKAPASTAWNYHPGQDGCGNFIARKTKTPGAGLAPLLSTGLCS